MMHSRKLHNIQLELDELDIRYQPIFKPNEKKYIVDHVIYNKNIYLFVDGDMNHLKLELKEHPSQYEYGKYSHQNECMYIKKYNEMFQLYRQDFIKYIVGNITSDDVYKDLTILKKNVNKENISDIYKDLTCTNIVLLSDNIPKAHFKLYFISVDNCLDKLLIKNGYTKINAIHYNNKIYTSCDIILYGEYDLSTVYIKKLDMILLKYSTTYFTTYKLFRNTNEQYDNKTNRRVRLSKINDDNTSLLILIIIIFSLILKLIFPK